MSPDKLSAIMNVQQNGHVTTFMCPCKDCSIDPESTVPMFYSLKHAEDEGWRFTKDIYYCDPKNKDGVWICPECCKRVELKNVHA